MKHLAIVLWLATIIVACSITHKSDGFACGPNGECASGRTCQDGFCVLPGGDPPGKDAGIDSGDPGKPDASNGCPSQCTTCDLDQQICNIDCTQSDCDGEVKCPEGFQCEIDCNADGSCTHGVDCTASASCDITCTGDGSCRNLQCGNGPCDIVCFGDQSCRNVQCMKSCRCDVECGDGSLCQQVTCSAPQCNAGLGGGCTSQNFQCDTCE